jgi:light-regulated signal transduction histidine kinase (bacteriophytochrome)
MQRSEVDLSALVRAIADDLLAKEPERQVMFDIEPGLKADADPVLLRTTLENLLGNAWKFTSKRGKAHIIFGLQQIDGEPLYFVKDNGAGFNMEYGKKLFVAFQRLHRQTEFPGTGIGLATVQRVIHRHGGWVWGEGKEGEGATFYFTLGDQSKNAATEAQDVHI